MFCEYAWYAFMLTSSFYFCNCRMPKTQPFILAHLISSKYVSLNDCSFWWFCYCYPLRRWGWTHFHPWWYCWGFHNITLWKIVWSWLSWRWRVHRHCSRSHSTRTRWWWWCEYCVWFIPGKIKIKWETALDMMPSFQALILQYKLILNLCFFYLTGRWWCDHVNRLCRQIGCIRKLILQHQRCRLTIWPQSQWLFWLHPDE